MLSVVVAFGVRCLLVGLFLPFSALDKILNFKQAIAQASQVASNRVFSTVLICCGLGVEIVMSAAILIGAADRAAAFILAGYCIVTALLWKQFWNEPNFRLQGTGAGRDMFWDFMKNVALAGGFLMLTFGSDAAGVVHFVRHPLQSSHPYRTPEARNGG